MKHIDNHGFSEFEIDEMRVKVKGGEEYEMLGCVGSSNEKMNTKVITKKCGGVVTKTKVKGDGTGELDIKLHVDTAVFAKLTDLNDDALIEGVEGYGEESTHPEFSSVQKVLDEENRVRYKAYPRCIITEFPEREIENGQTEVAESEMKISLMPDEYGYGMYQAFEDDLDDDVKEKWMTEFTPELVRKVPKA